MPVFGKSASSSVLKLGPAIQAAGLGFQSVVNVSQSISDTFLSDEIVAGLKVCAGMIGFDDYDPSTVSTCYMEVKDGVKRLYGPSLKMYGDDAVIVWGDRMFPLPDEASLTSPTMAKEIDERGASLLIDPKGYRLPVTLSIDIPLAYRIHVNSNDEKKDRPLSEMYEAVRGDLNICTNIEELKPCLNRAESSVLWSDIPDGVEMRIYSVYSARDRKDNTKIKSYRGLSLYEGKPCWVFMPGELSDWENVSVDEESPIVFVKNGSTITDQNGRAYEIKMGGIYTKPAFLNEGEKYKIIGFKHKPDGLHGPEYTLEAEIPSDQVIRVTKDKVAVEVKVAKGHIININGNKAIKDILEGKSSDAISPEKPAFLTIDRLYKTAAQKDAASITLSLYEYTQDPRLQALAARQAALKTA